MNPDHPTPRTTFQALLRELFQVADAAELDFGIYRIMGQKRGVIEKFIDQELLDGIDAELQRGALKREGSASAQLGDLAAQIRESLADDAIDPEGHLDPAYKKTKLGRDYLAVQQAGQGSRSMVELESTIYNHLYDFFKRYYDKGDFMSQRRYSKREKYAIPYNGEETYFHWSNADQYYIKTGETFTDYRWKDPSGAVRVKFSVTSANVPKDNIKAPEKRYFIPQLGGLTVETLGADAATADATDDPDQDRHTLLTLSFHYRGLTEAETKHYEEAAEAHEIKNGNGNGGKLQVAILAEAVEQLPQSAEVKRSRELVAALGAAHHQDAAGEPVSWLNHHLRRFTVKNTSDYFIHKDLAGFLTRELDFYLKNEVLHLDNLEVGGEQRAEGWFEMMCVIRRIGTQIIDFLAQIENFQKRLFEKKKFVTECHYCLTLDRVPAELYPEIAKNKKQIAEWKRLFAIDEAKGWSEPPTVAILKKHSNLVVDTGIMGDEFEQALLQHDGFASAMPENLVINSDNFQGVSLMGELHKGACDTIYIDPPYNTEASPICYKNGYKNSSWCSLLQSRVEVARPLLTKDGLLVGAIDDEQQREFSSVLKLCFNRDLLGVVCVRSNPSGRPKQTGYSVSHEYLLFAGNSANSHIGRLPLTEKQRARFNETDSEGTFEWRNLRREGSNSDRSARAHLFYPMYLSKDKIRIPKMQWNAADEEWDVLEKPKKGEVVTLPINDEGDEKTWRWEWETVVEKMSELSIRNDRSGRDYVYYKRRPNEAGAVSVSSWFDAKYSSTEHGTAVLKDMFGKSEFSYPKSIHAVSDALYISGCAKANTVALDFFAGSGTTAHAIIKLNRLDGQNRLYALVEQGDYFDTVLLPRIKKSTYSADWKSGKPTSRDTGISHCFKYLRLESYEDALGNIAFDENEVAQRQLDFDQYVIHYMLDCETRGSETWLNTEQLVAPFDYKLEIREGDALRVKPVDLPETFNFLIGLRVRTRRVYWREVQRRKQRQRLKYLVLCGRTNPHATGGEREVVVIWRTTEGWQQADYIADRAFIEEELALTADADEVFYNDDSLLRHANAKSLDPVFKRRMFNQAD